jgi:tetratricopeptide (TPR) repeat protein
MSLATTSAAMVGRDAELALDDALRRAVPASPPPCSSAVRRASASPADGGVRRRVADEATVLTGWCLDYGSTPAPFGPLPAILRGVLDELGDRADEAAGPGRDALQLLLPERAVGPVDRSTIRPEGLRETIANLLEAAASVRPVVVVIEDLHWADAATLSMLSFLLRALAGRPVLFLLTCRIDEVRRGGAVRTFLAEAERARLLDRVTLDRLDANSVRDLVQGLRGPVGDVGLAKLMERSEGVPFFVEELLCNVQGPMPDTLRDVLLARFDALGDDARAVVRVASGSDGAISHDPLATLAGFGDERLDEAVREAMGAGIVGIADRESYGSGTRCCAKPCTTTCCPVSALACTGRMPTPWRRPARRRRPRVPLAPRPRLPACARGGGHRDAGGEEQLRLLDRGALRRTRPGTVGTGARPGGGRRHRADPLLAQVGSILRNGGDGERALAVVSLALDEIDPAVVDRPVHARLLRDKALYLQNLGRGGSADLFLEALAIVESEPGQERLRAALLGYLAGRYLIGARLEDAVATADEAFRLAESIGFDNVMSVAANLRGCSRIHLGEVAAGLADFRLSWEHAADHDAQLRYRVNYADSLNMLGRFREAVEVAEAGVAHSRTLGVERSTGAILSHNMVEPLLELGEIDRVEEISARDLAVRTLQVFRMYSTMSRIRALVWRGEMDEAVRVLGEWRSIAEGVAAVERQVWYSLHDVEILIALGLGDSVRAAAELRIVIEDPGQRLALMGRILLEGGRVVADLRADGHGALADATAELVRTRWLSCPPSCSTRTGPPCSRHCWTRIRNGSRRPSCSSTVRTCPLSSARSSGWSAPECSWRRATGQPPSSW